MAETRHADMIVIGSIGRRGLQGLIVGNTAERVMRAASTPVLIVKPEGFRAPF
ncbi:MAG: universal stress protein [Polyangiaceae bacterium]